MDRNTLSDYSFFYNLSNEKGINHIFNEYMDFDRDDIVPVGVSHGVDFEHCYHPMDVYSTEPIYWAYNTRIFERAKKIKPCLLMAHPWAIVVSENNLIKGSGTLIIGPPPGRSNDQLLYDKVKNDITSDWSILIKGGIKESMQFWKEKGVKPITAGNNDNGRFFYDLFDMLSRYENIVACTFSSAVIFAASIEKNISFIEGYQYTCYETPNYLDIINFESSYSKFVVSEFVNNDKEDISGLAREILGFDLLLQKDRVKQDYFNLLENIDSPVFCKKLEQERLIKLKISLARLSSRPDLINRSILDLVLAFKKIILKNKVMIKTLDELSIWLDGKNKSNFISRLVPYKKGVTIPGKAVDKY